MYEDLCDKFTDRSGEYYNEDTAMRLIDTIKVMVRSIIDNMESIKTSCDGEINNFSTLSFPQSMELSIEERINRIRTSFESIITEYDDENYNAWINIFMLQCCIIFSRDYVIKEIFNPPQELFQLYEFIIANDWLSYQGMKQIIYGVKNEILINLNPFRRCSWNFFGEVP